jgi:bacteriocin biosynthesis cyclodehydratase domain-containing protein
MSNPAESDARLLVCPIAVSAVVGGVVIKRGATELRIAGDGAGEALDTLLAALLPDGATRSELLAHFDDEHHATIGTLIDELVARRLLMQQAADSGNLHRVESPTGIFYWQFGEDYPAVTARLSATSIVILGVNAIGLHLAGRLAESGFSPPLIVDCPDLRNIRLASTDNGEPAWPAGIPGPTSLEQWLAEHQPTENQCVVATSDFGGLILMREWNRFCIEQNYMFMPVVLQNMVGFVGPFVVPGETPCFECARGRQNANLDDAEGTRLPESAAFDTQLMAGYHPSMPTMVADLAALELTKLFGGRLPGWRVGGLIEIDLLEPAITIRKILRLPRCQACSSLRRTGAVSLEERAFVPHQTRSAN